MLVPRNLLEATGLRRGLPMIFVHTPKCGGMYVAQAIGNRRERHCITRRHPTMQGHKTYVEFRDALAALNINIDDFVTFGLVRNPWSWHVSFFHYVRGLTGRNKSKHESLVEKMNSISFPDYVASFDNPDPKKRIDIASARQVHEWVTDESGNIAVDDVLRMETLRTDLEALRDKYSLRMNIPDQNINTSKHDDYRKYYSDREIEIIADRHRRDIELFSYTFDK
ncbi:MAG: sulfotransferase family 2 domain-containing protein [Rhodobacteraceae bacterium]|nr:sulfotransferase family 2 domain-containing protein [Paracoccaceae bacterium]